MDIVYAYPFTAPKVSPLVICRSMNQAAVNLGRIARAAPADTGPS